MLTVVCKATFQLKPGQTATLVAPDAPAVTDQPWHRDAQSIGVPTDLVPFKRNIDVLLVGHAYAPQRRPVSSLLVGLSVGTLNKSILVTGDRTWEPDGTCPEPTPFLRMPLSWERAAGGQSTWNPVGIPVGARIDPQLRPPIPNLLPRGFVVQNSTHLIPSVGFGALAPHWPGRAAHVRKWSASWNHAKWYENLLPPELDAAYFNAAPTDQQLREFPETLQIVLDHLHPDWPRMTTIIEDLRPRARVTRSPASAAQDVPLRADTVLIDGDRGTCSITWRATIALRDPREEGVVFVEPTRGVAPPTRAKTQVMVPAQNSPPAATPPTNPSAATNPNPASHPSPSENRRWENNPLMSMKVDEFTTLPLRGEMPSKTQPLPFRPPSPSSPPGALPNAPSPSTPPPAPPPRREFPSMSMPVDENITLDTRSKSTSEAPPLPFRSSAPSSLNFRDDDEVTAIRAKPVPKPAPIAAPEQPAPPAPVAAPPAARPVKVGRTLIPDVPPKNEPALPFRPAAQNPDEAALARNRLAALGSSSGLPFQTPNAPSDAPPHRERLPSVPPGSPFSVALPAAAADTFAPPVPPVGLPFQTPPPPPRATAPSSPGLPFQTPAASEPPPPPRERLASVPPTAGLFSTPLQAAPPLAPPVPTGNEGPKPMSWSRLSGPGDEVKPLVSTAQTDVPAPTKPPKREFSFERYAQIKVHLWAPDAAREDVLSKHGIDEIEWRILEQQQSEALDLEAKEGKCDLALALVAAFEAANAPSLTAP